MSATPEQIAAELEELVKSLCHETSIGWDYKDDLRAAAALIRAQAERVRVLEGALKPFADEAALWADMWADDFHPIQDTSVSCSQCGESMEKPERARFTIGDLRRARAALRGEA